MRTILYLLIFVILIISPIGYFSTVQAADQNPTVLFDESGVMNKFFSIDNVGHSGSSTFVNLLQNNGFNVESTSNDPLTYNEIKDYDVLIILGSKRNYTSSEVNDIKEYVNNGGGLFLIMVPWDTIDGDENSFGNSIARSFGKNLAFNVLVVDQVNKIALSDFIKVNNISSSPINSNITEYYYIQGSYIKDAGNTSTSHSSNESWADELIVGSDGYSYKNDKKENNETSGPLALYSAFEYGKGKVVITGSSLSYTNTYIYNTNSWKLGLNSMFWLSNKPIPTSYKTAPTASMNTPNLLTSIIITILAALIIIAGVYFALKKHQKTKYIIKTIKNWLYNLLIVLNALFLVFGILIFIPINLILFDRTASELYDPLFGYALLIFGAVFIVFSSIILFNIISREHISTKFCLFNSGLLIFFAVFNSVLNNVLSFPMMLYFSLGGIFLLIPSLFNLWIVRGHGPDLIIEGKEFNRLAKLAIKSFPFELHGIYKEPTFLGEGGFGRVFKATRSDGQDVAIKIPKTFDKRSEKTFIAEVNNWNKLEHPNIVKLYDYKILPIPFIEVEYCKDGSIGHGKMPLDDAINVIYQVAHALSYAHQKNIIHGDIKTGNILKSNGLYKISDWGLSKLKTEDSVTLSGATPQYAAPEQISREFGKADERTDIYQLGDVFYELVTGELPFTGEVSEIYGSILTRDPVPPADINPQATSVEPIIMKCLEKIKDDRYSSMDELIRSLEQLGPIKPPESDTIIYKDEDEQKD